MKLHLPTQLRAALLACMVAAASFTTTIATGTLAGGALVATLAVSSQAEAATPTGNGTQEDPYTFTNPAKDIDLSAYGEGTYVKMDVENATAGSTTPPSDSDTCFSDSNWTTQADLEIVHMTISNGYNANGGRTYTFAGAVTGAGDFFYNTSAVGGEQNWSFSGDISGWTGNILIKGNNESYDLSLTGGGAVNLASITGTNSGGTERRLTLTVGKGGVNTILTNTSLNLATVNVAAGAGGVTFGGAVTANTANINSDATLNDVVSVTTVNIASGATMTLGSTGTLLVNTVSNNGTLIFEEGARVLVDMAGGTLTHSSDNSGYTVSKSLDLSTWGNMTGVDADLFVASLGGEIGPTATSGYDQDTNTATVTQTYTWQGWGSAGPNSTGPNLFEQDKALASAPTGNALYLSAADSGYSLTGGGVGVAILGNIQNSSLCVYGGMNQASSGSSENPDESWIYIDGATVGNVVGGNLAENWSSGSPSHFYGDSHIVMHSGSVSNIIGGTLRDGQQAKFTGNTYIAVSGGNVGGFIVGAGTTAHAGSGHSYFEGTTNISVTTLLSTPDTTLKLDFNDGTVIQANYAAVVGGGVTARNSSSLVNFTGTTNVDVDLSAISEDSGEFGKRIVGGSLVWNGNTATHTGSTNVSLTGKEGISFAQDIVGGNLNVGESGSISQTGDVTLTVGAGTYTGSIYGGSYAAGGTGTLTGNVQISVEDGANIQNNIYAAGGVAAGSSASMTLNGNTTLTLATGVVLANDITISGGYENASANTKVTGSSTLAITGSGILDASQVTLTDFTQISLESDTTLKVGTLKQNGTLTVSGSGTLDLSSAALTPVSELSTSDLELFGAPTLDGDILTEKYYLIKGDGTTLQGYSGSDFTLDNNNLIYILEAHVNGWDVNWGAQGLVGSPDVAALPLYSENSSSWTGESSSSVTDSIVEEMQLNMLSGVASCTRSDGSTQINLDGAGSSTLSIVGGAKSGDVGTAAAPVGSWIAVTGGSWYNIVGGSYANDQDVHFYGDSHVLIDGSEASVQNIIGGNMRDLSGNLFQGDSYITVREGSVLGYIIGGGTNAHMGTNNFVGDTHVFVYTLLSTGDSVKVDPHQSQLDQTNAAVVGGSGVARNNGGGRLSLQGNTNVVIDLTDAGSGEFQKKIIGGSIVITAASSASQTGTSNVTISGTTEQTFTKEIVGGSYNVNTSGAISHAKETQVTINASGSTFSDVIVGGSYTAGSGAVTHQAESSVSITSDGGTFSGMIVGGSLSSNLKGNITHNAGTGVEIDATAGGTFSGMIIGGTAAKEATGSHTMGISGDTGVTITSQTGSNAEFNGDIAGGSYAYVTGGSILPNLNISGTSRVQIDGEGATFNGQVVGGSITGAYAGGPVIRLVDSELKISGGTFTSDVVAGASAASWSNVNVSGISSLEVTGGQFSGNVIGASKVQGSTTSYSSTGDNVLMNLSGGTYAEDSRIVGGYYVHGGRVDISGNYTLAGTVNVTIGSDASSGGPEVNGTIYGGSYYNTTATMGGDRKLTQNDIIVTVLSGQINGSIYAAGGVVEGSTGAAITTGNTTVALSEKTVIGDGITISGGYENSIENRTTFVEGSSRTLATTGTGTVDLSKDTITLQDFTVANVAEAGSTLNIGSKLAASGITQKTGAGTLAISGTNNVSLAVNAGSLQTAAGTSLTGLTFADNTALKLGGSNLALDSLTFGSGFAIDVTDLGISSASDYTLAAVGNLTGTVGDIQIAGLDSSLYTWELNYQDGSLVLSVANAIVAQDLVWNPDATDQVWTPEDDNSFQNNLVFHNGDNVIFAATATPTLQGDITVSTLTANADVSLNVTADTPASLTVNELVLGTGGSLAKTGEGTLTVSENILTDGALDIQAGTVAASLDGKSVTYNATSSTGSGTLALTVSNSNDNALAFGSTFNGTLELTAASTDNGGLLSISQAAAAKLKVNSGVTVDWGSSFSSGNAVTLSGDGEVVLRIGSGAGTNQITYSDDWTGTIVLSGSGSEFNFNASGQSFGTANSTIEFKGLKGYVAPGAASIVSNVILTNPGTETNNYAWWWDKTWATSTTFEGSVSGDGELRVALSGNTSLGSALVFTGDVSGYNGKISFLPSRNAHPADEKQNYIEFSGSATEVNASIEVDAETGRAVWLQFTNDQDVAMNGSIKDNVTTGNTGTLSLHKSGSGTLTLTGENTYAGGTYIEGGTLVANETSLSQNTSLVLSDGTTFQFGNAGSDVYTLDNAISMATGATTGATLDFTTGQIDLASDMTNFTGTVTIQDPATLTVHTGALTMSGAGDVVIDAEGEVDWNGANKSYSGTTTITDGTTVNATGGLSTGGTAVTLGEGAKLVMVDVNTGYGTINTGTSGTVVLNTNGAFTSDAWIYGSGTIEIDVGEGNTLQTDNLSNAIANASQVTSGAPGRFTGTYLVTSGILEFNKDNGGKYCAGISDPADIVVAPDGQVKFTEMAATDLWTFDITLQTPTTANTAGLVFSAEGSMGKGENKGSLLMEGGTKLLVDGSAVTAITVQQYGAVSFSDNAAATIEVAAGDTFAFRGNLDTADATLVKTGTGILKLGWEDVDGITRMWDTSGTIKLQEGTLALYMGWGSNAPSWNGTISASDGTRIFKYDAKTTIGTLEVNGTVTLATDWDKAWILNKLTGDDASEVKLTRENVSGAESDRSSTTLTLQNANSDFSGTINVASKMELVLGNSDSAVNATVNLTKANAQLSVADADTTYNIATLNGTAGTVNAGTVNAGKYDVTNGGIFAGTLADGVELTVSGGTMNLDGATLAAADEGISIIGTGTGTIQNLLLGQGVSLSAAEGTTSTAPVNLDHLTLAAESDITFQMTEVSGETSSSGLPVYKPSTEAVYNAQGNLALDTSITTGGGKVSLILDPGTGVTVRNGTYTLISGVGPALQDGMDDAALRDIFDLNYSNSKRLTFELSVQTGDLILIKEGSSRDLTWQGDAAGSGIWRYQDGNDQEKPWVYGENKLPSDFDLGEAVTFGTLALSGTDPAVVTVEGTVQAGSIVVKGDTSYTWTNDAGTPGIITTVDGIKTSLLVGAPDAEFTGTLRIETTGAWTGSTIINSGTVVAANAEALSTDDAGADITVNDGGTLAVDLGEGTELRVTDISVNGGTLAATGDGGTLAGIALSGDTKLQGKGDAKLAVEINSIAADTSITSSGTVNINSLPTDATLSALAVTDGTTTLADGTSLSAGKVTVDGTLTVAGSASLETTAITGEGTLAVGSSDAIGNLIYGGKTLEMGAIVLNKATLTSTAEDGTTVSGAVTAGSQQDSSIMAAFEGTWKLVNLQEGANIQVGTGSGEGQQGHLTANKATGADITLFGEGSSLTVEEASAIQSVQATSGGNEVTLAGGTSVETLDLAASITGEKAVLVSDGTLTVSELMMSGTDASGVGTLVVTGASSISGESSMGEIVVDGQAASLTLSGSSAAGDLTIRQGRVTAGDAATTASSVTLSGTGATLDLTGGNLTSTITMTAGSLANAVNYDGTVDVTGASGTLAMGGLTDKATLNLTATGTALQLTGLSGVTLGTSSITLSNDMKDLAANKALLQLNAPASVTIASGAQVSVNINDILSGLLAADLNAETPSVSASFTIGNGNVDLNALDGAVTFDATLAVMNMTADFTESGQLVITRHSAYDEDAIYVATEDQGTGVVEWAGNGKENVYDSAEGFVAIVIDQDTAISLKGEEIPADKQDTGLNLANLVGANGATLTVQGENTADSDVRDLVTINPNISVDELPDNVGNSLSYNGNINLEGTDLQLKATDASTGEHTPDTVYAVNGKLTADENSTVILTSGTLQLNGTGNTLSGGLTVTEEGGVQTNGDTTLSNTISGTAGSDTAQGVDIAVGSGKELTLAGASLEGVRIGGAEGSQMTIAAGATASTIDTASSVAGMLLHIEEGATLTVKAASPSSASMLQRSITTPTDGVLEYDGLTGKGTLASEVDANASLTLNVAAGDAYTFEGSMSGYNGTIILKGAGTQSFVSDAGGTTFAVQGGNLVLGSGVSSVKNLSLSGAEGMTGSATLNLAGSDTSTNRTFTVNDTISLTAGSTLNLTLNLTKSMLSGTGAIQTTGSTYEGGTVAITFAGIQSDLDLTGGKDIEAVIVQGTEKAEGSKVTLTDTGDKLLEKYFGDTAALQVEGGNLVLTGTTVDASTARFHQDAAITKNGHTGAAMLDALYSTSNPQVNDPDSAAAAVLDELEAMILAGNTGAADRKMAAVAGASATAMGAALAGDMQRQLTAIRNRTTTMGVSDAYVSPDMPYFNAWVNAEGNYRTMEQDGTLAGYEINSWGATLGFDADITPKFTAGLALTAMYGDLTAKAADMAEGDLNTYYVTAFARYAPSAWVHTFVASIGMADASLDRTVSAGDGAYKTSGDTNGFGFGLMYEVGYTIPMNEEGSTALQPIANITYTHTSLDGYTETGSDMAVRYGDQTMDTLTIGLGLRAQTVVGENIYNRSSLLEGRVLAKFDLGDRSSSATAGLAGLGRVAGDVESAEIGAVGLELGAGLTVPVGSEGGSLFLDGSLELRSDYTNVNATVGYRLNF